MPWFRVPSPPFKESSLPPIVIERKDCDPPIVTPKTEWNNIRGSLFKCLCNPQTQLSQDWQTVFLENLKDERIKAIENGDKTVPNLSALGKYNTRVCQFENMFSESFNIPHISNCVYMGEDDFSVVDVSVIRWLTEMDVPLKKRLFELETMPCFLEPIAEALRSILKYYSTLIVLPPEPMEEEDVRTFVLKEPSRDRLLWPGQAQLTP